MAQAGVSVHVVGTTHHSTPAGVRERFAFGADDAEAALRQLIARDAREAILVSTCNRTELYVSGGPAAVDRGAGLLAARAGLAPIEAQPYLTVRSDDACVEHLMRVAAGMDSLVVGEAHIQGQVRQAYELAARTCTDRRAAGPVLSRLFQSALNVGGRVRSETGLGTGSASVPGAAVALAERVVGSLRGRRVLLVGAGQMSALVLKHLADHDVASVTVASRTRHHADDLAKRFGAHAALMAELEPHLASADLIITATSCPRVLLTAETLRAARRDATHPLCIVDIAWPRDVDPCVGDMRDVSLFDIDDLRGILDENLARRRAEWPLAERIVQEGVREFRRWYAARRAVPMIRRLRADAERIRRQELAKAMKGFGRLEPEERRKIDVLSQQIVNKVLHGPTVRLREAAAADDGEALLAAARCLFE